MFEEKADLFNSHSCSFTFRTIKSGFADKHQDLMVFYTQVITDVGLMSFI